MADANKLVSMVALVIAGLLVAAFGAIFIWLNRNDRLVVADLQRRGLITAADVNRLTNSTWIWVLAIVQIVIGLVLVAWGIFQYFSSASDVVNVVQSKLVDTFTPTRNIAAVNAAVVPGPAVVASAGQPLMAGARRDMGSRRAY